MLTVSQRKAALVRKITDAQNLIDQLRKDFKDKTIMRSAHVGAIMGAYSDFEKAKQDIEWATRELELY